MVFEKPSLMIDVFFNDGDGAFTAHTIFAADRNLFAVTAADIKDDAYLYLVRTHKVAHSIANCSNTSNGMFTTPTIYLFDLIILRRVIVEDVNGDHKLDIVVSSSVSRNDASVRICVY